MVTNTDKIKIKPLPYLRLFLVLFLLINLLGTFNFPFYIEELDNKDLFFLIILGFLGFFSGTLIIRLLKIKITPLKGSFKPRVFKLVFITVNALSFFLIALTHFKNGGILMFLGDKRFVTYAYTTVFIYLGIIITLLYFSQVLLSNNKISKRLILFIIIQSLSVLSMGYRSPLIILACGVIKLK